MPPKVQAHQVDLFQTPSFGEVATAQYTGPTAVLKFRFKAEYPVYLEVWYGGKPLNFAKKNLVQFQVFTPPGETLKWVEVCMPLAYAKKRGLL